MSKDHDQPTRLEREYTEAARLMAGLYAIEHLIEHYPPSSEVGAAYDTFADAASEAYALAREANLSENEWAYNEDPSPLIHPDYTDPGKRRSVVVAIVDAEEGDLQIETVGPFPMYVEDPDDSSVHTIHTEDELLEHYRGMYGDAVTTIRPMPFAAAPAASEDDENHRTGGEA